MVTYNKESKKYIDLYYHNIATSNLDDNMVLTANDSPYNTLSLDNIIEQIESRLQYTRDVIVPCEWCGQYGAIKTNCRFCSRPIKGD